MEKMHLDEHKVKCVYFFVFKLAIIFGYLLYDLNC